MYKKLGFNQKHQLTFIEKHKIILKQKSGQHLRAISQNLSFFSNTRELLLSSIYFRIKSYALVSTRMLVLMVCDVNQN